jgi:hypothetical protein
MSDYQDATFYAQVEPEWGYGRDANGERRLAGAKVARITQKRPGSPIAGTVMVKLTIRVPRSAFLPLRPAAVVVIPEDMTVTTPVEVVAEDPS